MAKRNHQDQIQLVIETLGTYSYPKGVSLEAVSLDFQKDCQELIVAAIVDNELKELRTLLESDCHLKFITIHTSIGSRIYQRSLVFVFIRACMELFSGCRVSVEHSISRGLYCEVQYKRPIMQQDVERIEARMREIVKEDVPFIKNRVPLEEATEIFREYGQMNKVKLLKYREKPYINLYQCGWLKNYFYGYMVSSTKYLEEFRLQFCAPGVVLQSPLSEYGGKLAAFIQQPKLFKAFRECEKWAEILDIDYVASLNDLIVAKKEGEFIRVQEALHEKKIAGIADLIAADHEEKQLILIAGPSSSGKTTFAQRLMVQLKVNGLKPQAISLDDYFVDREKTPLNEAGEHDFESLEAIDLETFNRDLAALLKGETVEVPSFNFHTGKREYRGHFMQVEPGQPLLLEGIHGLNEALTREIPKNRKFKIYISALTQLNIDEHNRIPTTDTRLIRRMVRDNKFRSNDATRTLSLWPSVRRGEEKNIFPYQEEADVMFNSALFYEMSILKKYAEPLLRQLDLSNPYYSEAKRLLSFLSYFVILENETEVPRTSILKEFIGNLEG